MKKIIKTTERNWQCPYCGFLNNLSNNTCEKCGAVRNGDEVEKEITTNFEETTTTETPDVSDIVGTNRKHLQATLSVVIGIFALIAVLLMIAVITSSISTRTRRTSTDTEQYTIISKNWEYTVSIGEYVEETGITSYSEPPKGATNIQTNQIMQSNGWYKTQYTYDYTDWKVVRTETITGENDIPTFKEYSLAEGEKLMNSLIIRYTVTVKTASGKKVLSVSEEKWITLVPGNTYLSSEF